MRTTINIIHNFGDIDWKNYWIEKINVLVYSSGTDVNVSGVMIPAFGMMWFFVVLFFGRSLLDYIHLYVKNWHLFVTVFLMSILGICIGRLQWLPLSFDIVLAVMIFFFFGDYLKKVDMNNNSLLFCIISLLVWGGSFALIYFVFHDYLELAGRRYPVFPLCYITAISGTVFIAFLSKFISGFTWAKPLVYLGRFSLYLFCVHAMDYLYDFAWNRTDNNIVNGIIRISMDCVIAVILITIISKIKPEKSD